MDKLSEHAIRMLEIVDGENDFFRNDAKRQADIARAIYDTILQVQMLKMADRKTEPLDKDTNVRSKAVYDKWGNVFDARADIEDEPQTDCKTCRHNKSGRYEKGSLSCGRCCGTNFEFYEPKTEPQTDGRRE